MMDRRTNLMRCDIIETAEDYRLEIELPGCDKDKIRAYVEKGYLNVSADYTAVPEASENNIKYLARERYTGTCRRQFYVGDIHTEDIKASYVNGILILTLPKAAYHKAEERRHITIA